MPPDMVYIAPLMTPPSPMGDITIPHRFWPESEHCQYLNIWSRDLNPETKKPVSSGSRRWILWRQLYRNGGL